MTDSLVTDVPRTADEIVNRAHEMGGGDLFPKLSDEELAQIADDGKVPKHEIWGDRIKSGELAIDTLLNFAGLASFESDQQELDDRIEKLIARVIVPYLNSIHLTTHLTNLFILESVRRHYLVHYDNLVTGLVPVEDGHLTPPEGPGLGVESQAASAGRPRN